MVWVEMGDIVAANPPTEREIRQVEDWISRRAKPRFYADENFPKAVTAMIRRWGADVLTTQEAMRKGHPDENHVAEALRLHRILITCDRDYLNDRRFPLVSCPAIVVCDFGRGTAREIFDTLRCIKGTFRAPQFYDKWIKIDANSDHWTEHCRFLDGSTSHCRRRIYRGRLQEWSDE